MIRELQSRSQAKIQIDHSGVSGLQADQKQVTITGTADSVAKAKEMVLFLVANPMCDAQQSLNMLIDDKVRTGGIWGSGPPYLNLPNQGHNMQPHMMPQPSHGYNYANPAVPGGYGAAQVGLQQYGGAPQGGPQYPQQAYPVVQPAAYAAAGSMMMGGGGRETEMIYAQKQYMGRIIGSKGVTVNDLQRRSGCDIQINQVCCNAHYRRTQMFINFSLTLIVRLLSISFYCTILDRSDVCDSNRSCA
jgi:KH domain